MSTFTELPPSSVPVFTTLASYREWRQNVFDQKKSVGFVATMGALHEGHLSLVRKSLAANDLTVLSIFVNPAQFAPHEDLTTYPRTLPRDLELLSSISLSVLVPGTVEEIVRTPSAVFLPSVPEMYPSGISQDVSEQKGTFVEVRGYGHQMEGKSRPNFFRGVATVVTKLFNAVEPTRTYFGQKDIQQALLLRRMTRDTLLSHPSPENLHIVPTARDPVTSLALSSRNTYLTPRERELAAPALYAALMVAQSAWSSGDNIDTCIQRARQVISETETRLNSGQHEKIDMKLDYIEMNDPETFNLLSGVTTKAQWEAEKDEGRAVVLSGAMWVGKTRLIDNVILGDPRRLGIVD
ncbi:uncharacterized protein FIBRA_04628 [Fibroporia radiculosa]|uniref:Pantoate--beta-alanine ligase n=1 Tax=Fibroporia radiculosa TaxID=599839 RepID=J4IA96_9APHY|nr:uncharacterized protein FIBRA_04628 [Fibroporia radiculosa]CCM02526.1 predicted protein [Fibroporia radiculosa]